MPAKETSDRTPKTARTIDAPTDDILRTRRVIELRRAECGACPICRVIASAALLILDELRSR